MLLRSFATAGIAAGCLVFSPFSPLAASSSAQALTKVRIVSDNAVVMARPTLKGEALAAPPAATVLEALDKEGNWFWVLLERDAHGTRRAGWIREDVVEIVSEGRAGFSQPLSAPAAKPKARSKQQKQDERALRKAERELEKARRDFEKVSQQPGNSAPQQPADSALQPPADPTPPDSLPRD
jgi:hypothetical protein